MLAKGLGKPTDTALAVWIEKRHHRCCAEGSVVAPQPLFHLDHGCAKGERDEYTSECAAVQREGQYPRAKDHSCDDERARERGLAQENLADGDESGIEHTAELTAARPLLRKCAAIGGKERGLEEWRLLKARELGRREDKGTIHNIEGEREGWRAEGGHRRESCQARDSAR